MSLFKAREWWSAVSGYEEFHTNGSLALATVPSVHENKSTAVIVVGSFSGILRAYAPSAGAFSPDHLLLETQLSSPIIKVGVARLRCDSAPLLVLLHTKQLSYYSLSLSDDGSQLGLTPVNQLPLDHTSYDMMIGTMGKVKEQRICVQSLDGQLYIFDQNGQILSCSLPDVLLPGPISYIARTDTIVTVTAGRSLEAYRYQTLCSAAKSKKAKSDWMMNLSEPVIELKVIAAEKGSWYILVLGERNVFCLRDLGGVVFSKKLESCAACIYPYKYDNDGPSIYYLLASHTQQLQVFNNQVMIWSAILSHSPVAMTVGTFGDTKGLIVTLDELGHLQCSYLGTDPISFTQSLVTTNPVTDVQELEYELKQLQSTIENFDEKGATMSAAGVKCQLNIVNVHYSEPRPLESDNEDVNQRCVEAKIQLESFNPLMAEISIDLAPPLSVYPATLSCHVLGVKEIELTFVCSGDQWVVDNQVHLIISTHNSPPEDAHTLDHTLFLPLSLFCMPASPQDGQYKITLDSTHSCIPLSVLYQSSEGAESNAVSFELLTGQIVTMIASKSSNRYRIQSDSFPALYIFTADLINSLHKHYSKEPKFAVSYSSTLPLSEYFDYIEKHHKTRLGLQQCQELLGRHARQFRAIQKRLLARFKDKTPTGLVHLDTLLDGTFMQLMALTEKCEELYHEEEQTLGYLSSISRLIIKLMSLSVHLTPEDILMLESTLLPSVNANQGWEETVDVAITHLLRSTLAKSPKEEMVTLPDLSTIPSDCKRLKRHLALLCDRVVKGGRLSSSLTATRSLHQQQQQHDHNSSVIIQPSPLTTLLEEDNEQ